MFKQGDYILRETLEQLTLPERDALVKSFKFSNFHLYDADFNGWASNIPMPELGDAIGPYPYHNTVYWHDDIPTYFTNDLNINEDRTIIKLTAF